MENQTRRNRRKPSHQCKGGLNQAGKRFSYAMCITQGFRAFCVFPYSPNGMKLKFVDAAFPHNCWVSYLCATPNVGKIGAQAATSPSLPTQKNYFYVANIIKLSNNLDFWLLLTASRGRFDNNRSILN